MDQSQKYNMAELVEHFCLEALPKCGLEFLTALSEEYRITVPDDKKDDKRVILRLVVRHLTSDAVVTAPDEGAAIFLKLYKELGGELKKSAKSEPDMPPLEGEAEESVKDSVAAVSYHKLRQFKINGTIGDPGQKNCISYSSLCYQIKQGETQGYKDHEIYNGVIKAIEADNPFKEVLELASETYTKDAFMKTLKAHFEERDPNSVFNELRVASQGPKETAHKFVCRCVALKKKVLHMAAAEKMNFDEVNLNNTFYRTIYTGLRNKEIRNELRQILRDASMSEEDLLVEVSLAAANEKERVGKMMDHDRKVNVNKLTLDSESDDSSEDSSASVSSSSATSSSSSGLSKRQAKKQARARAKANQNNQNNSPKPQQTSQNSGNGTLTSADVQKMTAAFERLATSNVKLTAEVNVLKNMNRTSQNAPRMPLLNPTPPSTNNVTTGTGTNGNNLNARAPSFNSRQVRSATNRPLYFCENCIAANSFYCRHCFKCGKDDHKVKDCTEN